MSKLVTVSAPGKVHLLGEHSVVYGKPALLAAIDMRVSVSVLNSNKKTKTNKHIKDLQKVIEQAICRKYKLKQVPQYSLNIKSEIPLGFGLGSSAALSAAITKTLLKFLNIKHNRKDVFDIALEGEKYFHGNPSGGDLAAVIYGGIIWFQKKGEKRVIKKIKTTSANIAKNFYLLNTGKPAETTGEMVASVARSYKTDKKKFECIFNFQEKLTNKLLESLITGDEDAILEIIKQGEQNLEKIGVVSKYVASIIREIEQMGGAAKICGGGGIKHSTGMLLAYHPDIKAIKKIAQNLNIKFDQVKLGEEGLK